MSEDNLETINNKLDGLLPLAIDYNNSLKVNEPRAAPREVIQRLESTASALWNAIAVAIKLEKNELSRKTLCYSRLFVCVLLSIHEILIPSLNRKLRIIQCYVNTLKASIDHDWENLHQTINDQLGERLEVLDSAAKLFKNNEEVPFKRLKLEFQILNLQRAMRSGNIKFAKEIDCEADIGTNIEILDSSSLLELCRIIYNAVFTLKENSSEDLPSVCYFLERICNYLELNVPSLKVHVDYSHLRYSVLLLFTSSLMDQSIETLDLSKCESLLKILQNEYPKKLETYALNIEFCKKVGGSGLTQTIKEIIMRMITSLDIILNFDGIMGVINEFSALDTVLALECLDFILIDKLDPERNHKRLERLFVLRFFITTQSKHLNNLEIIQNLEEYCIQAQKKLMDVLSKHAMSSIVTLLWNSGKKSEKTGNFLESIGFYKIALKNSISQEYSERGKIQRALMFAYIQVDEFDQCQELHEKMVPEDKESSLTQLLMLKTFIRQPDKESSCIQCLERIKTSGHDNSMDTLILAVAECRTSKQLAIKAISMLFDAIESQQVSEQKLIQWSVPTLCLLRYTLQLIIKLTENEQLEVFIGYLVTMEQLLQKALDYLNRIRIIKRFHGFDNANPPEVTSVDEIEWFASTSYNIALKCVAESVNEIDVLDFAKISNDFIQLIPRQEFTFPRMFHYTYWAFRSQLLCLTLARDTKCGENLDALKQIQIESLNLMDEILRQKKCHDFEDGCSPHENEKMGECLKDALSLTFETSMQMRDQSRISEVLIKTAQWQDPQIEDLLADSATSMYELPRGLFLETIGPLIQRNVGSPHIEDFKLCQWLRNFLDCALTLGQNSSLALVESILRRIQTSLISTNTSNTDELRQEIEMIATLSWNQGVNSIIREEKSVGIAWCRTSIQFASLYSKHLEEQLKELWTSLASSAQLECD